MVSQDSFLTYYEPPAGNALFGTCGRGLEWQANILIRQNPRFRVFHVTREGEMHFYDDELSNFAERVNELFNEEAGAMLEEKRRRTGHKDLELTIHIARDGFRLIYSLPVRPKKEAYPAYRRAGLATLKVRGGVTVKRKATRRTRKSKTRKRR